MSKQALDVSICPTCKKLYDTNVRNPRVMDCGHTFCFDCLKNVDSQDGTICKICKKLSMSKHPQDLPWNYDILQSIQEQLFDKNPYGSEGICQFHSQSQMLFCIDHQELCCIVCASYGHHKRHNVVDIEKAVDMYKPSVIKMQEGLNSRQKYAEELLQKYGQTINDLSRNFSDYQKRFEMENQKLINDIKKQYQNKVNKAQEQFNKVMDKLTNAKQQLNEIINSIGNMERKSDSIKDLLEYIENAQKMISKMPEVGEPDFDFSATLDTKEVTQAVLPFGDIKIDVYSANAKVLKTLSGQNKFLYAIQWKSKNVLQFDTEKEKWKKKEVEHQDKHFKFPEGCN